MSVYVDEAIFPWRGKKWCHLWADTVEELHAFAAKLGLKRSWFQCPPKASWEHYDVSEGMRWQAIRLGAVRTDRYGASYFCAKRAGRTAMVKRIDALREEKRLRRCEQLVVGHVGECLACDAEQGEACRGRAA